MRKHVDRRRTPPTVLATAIKHSANCDSLSGAALFGSTASYAVTLETFFSAMIHLVCRVLTTTLPPGLGVGVRTMRMWLRCAGAAPLTQPLGRLPVHHRGPGRNVWLHPAGVDVGLVNALVANTARQSSADLVLWLRGVWLEHSIPEPDGRDAQWGLAPVCNASEAVAADANAFLGAVAAVPTGSCVIEARNDTLAEADETAGAEAICVVLDGGIQDAVGESAGHTHLPLGDAAGGTVSGSFWAGSALRFSGSDPRPIDYGVSDAEDASRALHDAESLDHWSDPDARSSAHARVTAAGTAHHRCVTRSNVHPLADFGLAHPAASVTGVTSPMTGPAQAASVWGDGAPLCTDDPTQGAGGIQQLLGGVSAGGEGGATWAELLRGVEAESGLLQTGASSEALAGAGAGALAGVRERLEAGIPGLDMMLGPIMDNVLGPVTQIIGGVVGDAVGGGLMNLVGQGTDSALTGEVTKILTSELAGALADQVVPPTGESVATAVTAATAAHIRQMVPKNVGETLADEISRKLVPRLAPALAERISERVANGVAGPLSGTLQHMLTRSVSAAVVPALAHSLTHSPAADYYCWLCKEKQLYCDYCHRSQFPATLAHAHYYAAYYGAYYAEWGAQPAAMRTGAAAAMAAKRAAEQAVAVRQSQSEYFAEKGASDK